MKCAAALLCLLPCVAGAEEPVDLIGDDLAGWSGSLSDWRVEDGVLIGLADGSLKSNRFIWADVEPVRNFELTVDVNVTPRGNSGIQYRSSLATDLGPFAMRGYQCDVVAARADYNGMLYEEKGRRILAHSGEKVVIDPEGQPWVVGTLPATEFAAGEWHTYRVRVEGNRHRHWIDGEPTAEVVDRDEAGRSLEGKVGVQVHVGPPMTVRYRNMRLTRLPDDLPLLDPDVPGDAVRVVPQGGRRKRSE